MPKLQQKLSICLILIAGFALRLYRLGAQSLWYDETVSAILARKSIPDLIAHTARDIHPPGYYLLLHFWRSLVGETEFALAFFSLAFGVLLIASVYLLGRNLLNRRAALWAAGLIAFSPYNVWYSQEVRMYTIGAFLGVMALYFAVKAVYNLRSNKQLWYWLGYTLSAVLGLYMLYYFAFLLIPLNLFLLGSLLRGRQQSPARFRNWLAANIALIVLYLPWLGTAWRQAVSPPVPPWRSDIPLSFMLSESWMALSFGESVTIEQVWPLLIITIGLFGLGLYTISAPRWRLLLPLLVFGPLAIIYLAPALNITNALYHVRYVFTYSPAFYLVLGAALAWLWQRQRLVGGLVGLLLVGGAAFSIQQLHTNPRNASDDFRSAMQILAARWRPSDIILLNAGYAYPAFQYYFSQPTQPHLRLTEFDPAQIDPYALQPLVLETGTIDGPESLGWGLPESDFYAMSQADTSEALRQVTQTFPRIWMLRIYDTVTDEKALIRGWLAENTRPFEDQVLSGNAQMRVQGFLSQMQPAPPLTTTISLDDHFVLHGYVPPAPQYYPSEVIDVAFWWEREQKQTSNIPYALSLKLWDGEGQVAAQTEPDEWPVGNRYFTPAWQPGEVIRYPMRLQLPPDIPPGQYWLNAILYNSETGSPVAITATGETSILLGGVEILPD